MTDFERSRRNLLKSAAALTVASALPGAAFAQSYPNGNVTVLVGYSAGGLTDTVARLLSEVMQAELGVPVVVVNRPGAAGGTALQELARTEPDGQTLLVSSVGQIAVVPHTNPEIGLDTRTELDHISLVGEGDFVFTVHSSLPIHTVDELKSYLAENPGALLYGTSGAGGNLHLATELFLELSGLEMEGIHYPGSSALMPDLLNNQIQFAINVYPAVSQYIEEGTLRPILVTGTERKPGIPDVPASPEVGMAELAECQNWFGVHAPKGTDPAIIARLSEIIATAVSSPSLVERLTRAGLTPRAMPPEMFTQRVADDYKLFGRIAEKAGLSS